jgi:hypothetical protein
MKLVAAASFAVGYVMGTKAGRERYEQIRRLAHNAAVNFDASGARQKLEAYTTRLDAYASRPSGRRTPTA